MGDVLPFPTPLLDYDRIPAGVELVPGQRYLWRTTIVTLSHIQHCDGAPLWEYESGATLCLQCGATTTSSKDST